MRPEIHVFNITPSDTCCQRLLCQKYAWNVFVRIFIYKTYKHFLLSHHQGSIKNYNERHQERDVDVGVKKLFKTISEMSNGII